MSKLDLEWLAVFDEVYKTGNVSKAAERLGMAQAAASTALNKLRAHFDDRLFTRTAHGMPHGVEDGVFAVPLGRQPAGAHRQRFRCAGIQFENGLAQPHIARIMVIALMPVLLD